MGPAADGGSEIKGTGKTELEYCTIVLIYAALFFKISRTYTGPVNTEVAEAMERCDSDGPLMIQITKLYHTADAQDFRAFGRIYSGTLKRGMEVKVLGEGYSPEDEEDMVKVVVEDVWISESRYAPIYINIHPRVCFGTQNVRF